MKMEDDDMNREEKCADCLWFVQSPSGVHGFCKVNPPVFTGIDDNGRPRFFNPVVSPHNFCSLFEED
jgi:hypothetical protein